MLPRIKEKIIIKNTRIVTASCRFYALPGSSPCSDCPSGGQFMLYGVLQSKMCRARGADPAGRAVAAS